MLFDAMRPELAAATTAGKEPDLGMRVQLVHGDETIADSEEAGGLAAACHKFQGWVRQQYFQETAATA